MRTPTSATRLLALLGDPVDHSLSPIIQNPAIEAADCDAVYLALRCDARSAPELLRGIARAGGGGNVTLPHKAIAAECVERATDAVRRTGVCNTYWFEDGVINGDNTDVDGVRRALAKLLPDAAGIRAVVIGAGGAGAAVLCALIDAGAAAITLYNRSPDRAHSLAARFAAEHDAIDTVLSVKDLREARFDLVVNASAAGMRDRDPLPVDLGTLDQPGAALDVVYRRGRTTAWVAHARRLGIPALDGTEMLLAQGAAAFERWFRVPAPIDAMRAALESR